ncbi:reverse transcriptase domain-containing protein [Tanacetum coccineum]
MLKWKFELEGYDIQYRPRTAIKGQILADFIMERPEEESPDELMAEPECYEPVDIVSQDGSSCVDGSGAGSAMTVKYIVLLQKSAAELDTPNHDSMAHFNKWGIDIAGPFPEGPGEGIKARLDERSRDWIEELPHVLWAHRTMIKSSNGETPFSLTYGTEAVIPAEIGMPTLRTAEIDQAKNNEALGINLDLIEEKREQAAIQEAKSKKKMEKYYNSRVRGTSFKPGEMVYRSNEASHAKDGGKLGPKWEGPYEVKESLGKGAYKLKDRKGNDMPRTWNICNLKKCYIHEM